MKGSGIKHKVGLGTDIKTDEPGTRLREQQEIRLDGCPRAIGKEYRMMGKGEWARFL